MKYKIFKLILVLTTPFLIILISSKQGFAQDTKKNVPSDADIKMAGVPSQYEVFEGVAVQFEGKNKGDSSNISGYEWSIVSGTGGKLENEKTSKVTFIAPQITTENEQFTLQLVTKYKNKKEGKARLNIIVHKRPADLKQQMQKEASNKTVEYRTTPWLAGAFGFGLGYIWSYPIYVPIVIPCPECDYNIPDIDLEKPVAIPQDELDTLGLDPGEYYAESMDVDTMDKVEIEPEAETTIGPVDIPDHQALDLPSEEVSVPMDNGIMDYGGGMDHGGDMDYGGDLGDMDMGDMDF